MRRVSLSTMLGALPARPRVLVLATLGVAALVLLTADPESASGNLTINLPTQRDGALLVRTSPAQLRLFAGETRTFRILVTNSGEPTTLRLTLSVTAVPAGGSASDIALAAPASVTAGRGTTSVVASVMAFQRAVPGRYEITTKLNFP